MIKTFLTLSLGVILALGALVPATNAADLATQIVEALDNGKVEEAKGLLAKTKDSTLLLMGASYFGETPKVKGLLSEGLAVDATEPAYGNTALNFASYGGQLEVVKLLLAKGANVNAVNKLGGTPLILAASTGHPEVVKFLLSKGADPTVKTKKDGDTALMKAKKKGHKEVVKILETQDKAK